jgi:ribulose-phosphate 3-epimerase
MKPEISASMMCADFLDMTGDLRALKKAGIEYLHFDVMDGVFVPNYTLGPCFLDALRAGTDITYDIHLMVDRPEDKLRFFDIRPGDFVSFHYESTCHVQRMLATIRSLGAKAGIALNPATPVQALDYLMDDIDFVLVMTVNPGYAGQKMIVSTLDKIAHVRRKLDQGGHYDIPIQVDGNVSFENARKMRQSGADIFVAGSSGLFRKDASIPEAAAKLREAIQ